MTQLSFDANKRLTILDLAPTSKAVRPLADSQELFRSHLNRAHAPTTATMPVGCPAPVVAGEASSCRAAEAPTSKASPQQESPSATSRPETTNSDASDAADESIEATQTNDESDQSTTAAHQPDDDAEKDDTEETAEAVLPPTGTVAATTELPTTAEADGGIELTTGVVVQVADETDHATTSSNQIDTQTKPARLPVKDAAGTSEVTQATDDDSSQFGTEPSESVVTTSSASEVLSQSADEVLVAANSSGSPKPATTQTAEAEASAVPNVTQTTSVGDTSLVLPEESNSETEDSEGASEKADSAQTKRDDRTARQPEGLGTSDQAQKNASKLANDVTPTSTDAPLAEASMGDASSEQEDGQAEHRPAPTVTSTSANKPIDGAAPSETSSSLKSIASPSEAPVVRSASLSSTRAGNDNEAPKSVDSARFVQRVYRALHVAHERGGEVRLRLSPPELGNLTLELKLHDGVMNAHIEAETPAARTLLLENVSILKERLASQDIQVERFEVDLMDRPPQQSPDGQSSEPDSGRATRRFTNRPGSQVARGADEQTATDVRPAAGSGQLNVII